MEGGYMKKSKINYDKKKDILYIFLRAGIEDRFEDVSENITVEYDKKDRPIGIEIFNASKLLGEKLFKSPLKNIQISI